MEQTYGQPTVRYAMNRVPSHIGRRWSNAEREEEDKERKGKRARD